MMAAILIVAGGWAIAALATCCAVAIVFKWAAELERYLI